MDTKFITEEDKRAYSEFFAHHLRGIASRRTPVPLHHYTSGENTIAILESKEIWATQIGCLSDAKELVHGSDLLGSAITEKIAEGPSKDFKALLEEMARLLSAPRPEVAGAFVVCFTEKPDDLSQWRAYGGNEGGYALQFDFGSLVAAAARIGSVIVPVAYDAGTKHILMNDILRWSECFFVKGLTEKRAPIPVQWVEEFASFWLWNLSFLLPMIKHDAFEAEAEWRLIYWLKDTDIPRMKFTQQQSMMRRHLPLELRADVNDSHSRLPLAGIMVGPTRHPELSRIGINDLLVKRSYAFRASMTDIPFRTTH